MVTTGGHNKMAGNELQVCVEKCAAMPYSIILFCKFLLFYRPVGMGSLYSSCNIVNIFLAIYFRQTDEKQKNILPIFIHLEIFFKHSKCF